MSGYSPKEMERIERENSDLRAKLEAAEKEIFELNETISSKDNLISDLASENQDNKKLVFSISEKRDDLRRQYIDYIKTHSLSDEAVGMIKSDLAAVIAALRGVLETIANYWCGSEETIHVIDAAEQTQAIARQALTASGESRYTRIEEAAKEVKDEFNKAYLCDMDGLVESIKNLIAALGDGE